MKAYSLSLRFALFDSLIHLSNVTYLCSYSVRNILWLRILTVVGILTLIPYYATRGANLNDAIIWNCIFATINVYQIFVLLKNRRPAKLSQREEALHALALTCMSNNQFYRLLKLGTWRTAAPGELFVTQGEPFHEIFLIGSGHASVKVDGQTVTILGPGSFVGEVAFLSGELPVASVETTEVVEYMVWSVDELNHALARESELREAFHRAVGRTVAVKLNQTSLRAVA